MELKEFIKEVVKSISDAVNELNNDSTPEGLIVNPKLGLNGDGRNTTRIDFNLSVSDSDKTNAGGGLKINVISAGINKETNNNTISTVSFCLDVILPGADAPERNYSE